MVAIAMNLKLSGALLLEQAVDKFQRKNIYFLGVPILRQREQTVEPVFRVLL